MHGRDAHKPGEDQARHSFTAHGWVLPHLVDCVNRRGADGDAIRRLPQLHDLSDPDLRVAESSVELAWRTAAALTGDEALGIHVAESLPRGALDLVEFAIRSSPSVALGLERLARFGRVVSDRVSAHFVSTPERVELVMGHRGAATLHPARTEFALAQALRLLRECAGQDLDPLSVSFAHSAPADPSAHQAFFRAPVHFAAETSRLVLSAADGARPFLTADEALASIVRRRLDKALGVSPPSGNDTVAAGVRQLLVESLGQAVLTPDAAARALALSRRTLSRRLAAEGTSFRTILDDVRREFAQTLARDSKLSIADIAFFLHYSEPAAFHRSFRRWTGRTPRAFREARLVDGDRRQDDTAGK